MKSKLLTLSFAAIVISLAGCGASSSDDEMEILSQKIGEIRMKPGGEVKPLPVFAKAEPFSYTAGNLRSVFEKPYKIVQKSKKSRSATSVSDIKPNEYRIKEPLELFDIEGLAFLGTMYYDENEIKAVIKDANNHSHMVTVGNYLGKNHGRIVDIGSDTIELVEIVPNGLGWIENPRTLRTK